MSKILTGPLVPSATALALRANSTQCPVNVLTEVTMQITHFQNCRWFIASGSRYRCDPTTIDRVFAWIAISIGQRGVLKMVAASRAVGYIRQELPIGCPPDERLQIRSSAVDGASVARGCCESLKRNRAVASLAFVLWIFCVPQGNGRKLKIVLARLHIGVF